MNETTILLSPSPGDPKAKPDFLATVEPLTIVPTSRDAPSFALPFELVLDGYTREPWSSGKEEGNSDGDQQRRRQQQQQDEWRSCYLVSTDGRNRLPGFMKYLRGRKKAAVARFEASEAAPSPMPGGGGRAVLVVPYDPPPIPAEAELPEGVDRSQVVFVKYLRDDGVLSKRGGVGDAKQKQQQQLQQQKKMQQQKMMQERQQQQQQQTAQQQKRGRPAPGPAPPASGKRGGLLGGLLGAQRRTENHLHVVRSSRVSSTDPAAFDPTAGAAGCINAFRTDVSSRLEAFRSDASAHVTRIPIDIASLEKSVPAEERDKVTMDVFKFAVYEQVEEVGADRWIAAKEPSDFMDECTIAVYKEGHCPPEVLEDLNKGELPDEAKGQAKHLMEAQSKAMQRKEKIRDELMVKQSLKEDNVRVLNTSKRDRRTMEQIQRDIQGGEGDDAKRGRLE